MYFRIMLSFFIRILVVLQKWLLIWFTEEYVMSSMLKFSFFFVSTPVGKNMVKVRNETKKLMTLSFVCCLYS